MVKTFKLVFYSWLFIFTIFSFLALNLNYSLAAVPPPGGGTGSSGGGTTSETIRLQLAQPFGTLPKEPFEISSGSIGVYIKAAYEFTAAAIVGLAIVMIIIAGIEWITAGGDGGKIGQAKDRMIKAFTGLFIALFAVFILRTVSPKTVEFAAIDAVYINPGVCCQLADKTFTYTETADLCTAKHGKVTPGECGSGNAAPPPASTATCTQHLLEPECTADTSCEWTNPPTGPCGAKTHPSGPQICWLNGANEGVCIANAAANCVFVKTKTCLPKTTEKDSTLAGICTIAANINDAAKCAAAGSGKCQYYASGGCDVQSSQLALKCNDFIDSSVCPRQHCGWWEISGWSWLTGSGICGEATNIWGTGCNESDACGAENFCCEEKECNKGNPIPSGSKGVCTPKLTPGACCGGLAADTFDGDVACTTGKCEIGISVACGGIFGGYECKQ